MVAALGATPGSNRGPYKTVVAAVAAIILLCGQMAFTYMLYIRKQQCGSLTGGVAVQLLESSRNSSVISTSDVNLGVATKPKEAHQRDAAGGYNGLQSHPVCAFFRSNAHRHPGGDEKRWGAGSDGLCMHENAKAWLTRSKSNCYSCMEPGVNVCSGTHTVNFHMGMSKLDDELPEHSLLTLQAFLMTQDLTKARLVLWSEQPDVLITNATAWFFDAFADYVTLRLFNYTKEIQGTIWQHDPFFSNVTLVKQALPVPSAYADVTRMVILHNHGGLWIDTDVFLFQDVTHLLLTGYQFVMRFMNNHIMFMKAGSPLTHRMMWLATTMPANHPQLEHELIRNRCKKHGYYQMNKKLYGYTDMYNGCLLRELVRFNNTGPAADAVLYDMPLGWWDPEWAGCHHPRKWNLTDAKWRDITSSYLSVHPRYPRLKEMGAAHSTLRRVIATVDGFFRACRTKHCLPVLAAYDGFWQPPSSKTKKS